MVRTLGDEVEAEGQLALEDVDLAALLLEREQVVAEPAAGGISVRVRRRQLHLHRRSQGGIDPDGTGRARKRRRGEGEEGGGGGRERESRSGRRVSCFLHGKEGSSDGWGEGGWIGTDGNKEWMNIRRGIPIPFCSGRVVGLERMPRIHRDDAESLSRGRGLRQLHQAGTDRRGKENIPVIILLPVSRVMVDP